jgi:hypothetical protein
VWNLVRVHADHAVVRFNTASHRGSGGGGIRDKIVSRIRSHHPDNRQSLHMQFFAGPYTIVTRQSHMIKAHAIANA